LATVRLKIEGGEKGVHLIERKRRGKKKEGVKTSNSRGKKRMSSAEKKNLTEQIQKVIVLGEVERCSAKG